MEDIEIKVGEVHSEWTGFPVICVETEFNNCSNCLFFQNFGYGCCMPQFICEKWRRSDKKQVYFKDNRN